MCSPLQEELSSILDAMFERAVAAGEHVIEQHDDGDNFYVIDRQGSHYLYTKNRLTDSLYYLYIIFDCGRINCKKNFCQLNAFSQ